MSVSEHYEPIPAEHLADDPPGAYRCVLPHPTEDRLCNDSVYPHEFETHEEWHRVHESKKE